MRYTVYVLKSRRILKYYVGMTCDLERGLSQHNDGKCRSTAASRPWKVIHTEFFTSSVDARAREKYFKTGAMYIRQLVAFLG
ncbi:MAG: GIY-YIG nuclease family protein [Cyclobacteriaceae bacterium]|nr:GIY-YIG nuclease family protein [Cyclobacteriaceae bacterium]